MRKKVRNADTGDGQRANDGYERVKEEINMI